MVGSNQNNFYQRAAAGQMIAVLSGHPILGILFMLPTMSFSRSQRAVMIYVLVMMQFYGQMLFWGTSNEDGGTMVALPLG